MLFFWVGEKAGGRGRSPGSGWTPRKSLIEVTHTYFRDSTCGLQYPRFLTGPVFFRRTDSFFSDLKILALMAVKQRSLSYHGIPIPPWRDRKIGAGPCTLRFVIKGYVPSKKNNQQAICRRKEAKAFLNDIKSGTITKDQAFQAIKLVTAKMRGNSRYIKFLDDQKPAIDLQRQYWLERFESKGLIFPISKAVLNIRFYFAQKYRQDSVNKQQSVQDLLKDCHIIFDDDYTCINPITADADCFAGDITENLVVVSLTFKLPKNGKQITASANSGDQQRPEK